MFYEKSDSKAVLKIGVMMLMPKVFQLLIFSKHLRFKDGFLTSSTLVKFVV